MLHYELCRHRDDELVDNRFWTNPLRGSRVIETSFSDFTDATADAPLPLA
jgi:hypothetical protein